VTYDGEADGEPVIAIDHVQAGTGDFVFMAMGKDSAWPIGRNTPVDLGIMGIIDEVTLRKIASAGE
jgi:microcompartment protein CcmK/EutM